MGNTLEIIIYQTKYFLNMRNKIIKNELSVEDASKEVGQVWFDKYYKNPKNE